MRSRVKSCCAACISGHKHRTGATTNAAPSGKNRPSRRRGTQRNCGTAVVSSRAGGTAINSGRGACYGASSSSRFCNCKRECLYRCGRRCTSFRAIRRITVCIECVQSIAVRSGIQQTCIHVRSDIGSNGSDLRISARCSRLPFDVETGFVSRIIKPG